jgi:hypothetical protein
MASFAKIGLNNKVIATIEVVDSVCLDSNGNFDEYLGKQYLQELTKWPSNHWVRFCRNTINGIYIDPITRLSGDQSLAFRKHPAEIGGTFDEEKNAFLPKKPFNSWIFDENIWGWKASKEKPSDVVDGVPRKVYWDEATQEWIINS